MQNGKKDNKNRFKHQALVVFCYFDKEKVSKYLGIDKNANESFHFW
jgi:hypothetical protein